MEGRLLFLGKDLRSTMFLALSQQVDINIMHKMGFGTRLPSGPDIGLLALACGRQRRAAGSRVTARGPPGGQSPNQPHQL